MVSAFLSYIMSFVMFYFLRDFLFLALAMVLFAFGEAFRSGTHKALILTYLKEKGISDLKVAYYGLTRSASQLGSAVNALIAAGLVFYSGSYRVMFLASTIPYTLDLLNVASYPKRLDGTLGQIRIGEISARIKSILKDFSGIFSSGSVLRALLNSSSFGAMFKSTKDYLQPIMVLLSMSLVLFSNLDDIRREAIFIGLIYFGIYLLSSFASRRAYRFSERFKSLPSAMNITYMIGIGLLILSGLTVNWKVNLAAVICFVGLFVINNIRRPINVGVISDQISSQVMASGLSTEALLTTIFSAVIAPVLGAMVDAFGVGSGLALGGMLMLLLILFVRVPESNA